MNVYESNLGSYEIVDKKPIVLTITNIGKNKLSISGDVALSLNIPCDRCLEDVKTDINFSIEKNIDMSEDDSDGVKESEEQDYISGYNLDVDKLVYSDILINIRSKILCKEDCKGLCTKCGANLNIAECGCDRQVLDPRMSVIQDIFNNYKEV
jgi:uncharacterized protein